METRILAYEAGSKDKSTYHRRFIRREYIYIYIYLWCHGICYSKLRLRSRGKADDLSQINPAFNLSRRAMCLGRLLGRKSTCLEFLDLISHPTSNSRIIFFYRICSDFDSLQFGKTRTLTIKSYHLFWKTNIISHHSHQKKTRFFVWWSELYSSSSCPFILAPKKYKNNKYYNYIKSKYNFFIQIR